MADLFVYGWGRRRHLARPGTLTADSYAMSWCGHQYPTLTRRTRDDQRWPALRRMPLCAHCEREQAKAAGSEVGVLPDQQDAETAEDQP